MRGTIQRQLRDLAPMARGGDLATKPSGSMESSHCSWRSPVVIGLQYCEPPRSGRPRPRLDHLDSDHGNRAIRSRSQPGAALVSLAARGGPTGARVGVVAVEVSVMMPFFFFDDVEVKCFRG